MDPPQDPLDSPLDVTAWLLHILTADGGRAALTSKDWSTGHWREEGLYDSADEALARIIELDAAGRDPYIGACSYGPGPKRTADNVVRAPFLYADNDRGTEGRYEPTLRVASGTPNHFHDWHGLREDIDLTDRKASDIFQRKLRSLQTDSSLTKVLRLPGTRNRKDGIRPVTVVEFNPLWAMPYELFPASPNGASTGGSIPPGFPEPFPSPVAIDPAVLPEKLAELWQEGNGDCPMVAEGKHVTGGRHDRSKHDKGRVLLDVSSARYRRRGHREGALSHGA